jgi:hypothetical protein
MKNWLSNVDWQRERQCRVTSMSRNVCQRTQDCLTQAPKINNNNNNNNKVQSALEDSNYKLHYDRSVITARTVHNNRPDIRVVIPDKTTKETHSIDVAIPNSHNLSTITEKLQKYTDLKEEFVRIWKLKMVYTIPLVLSTTGTITNKLHEILELNNLHPALFILMQKAVILNTCRIIRKFLAEQRIRSVWSVRPYCFEN